MLEVVRNGRNKKTMWMWQHTVNIQTIKPVPAPHDTTLSSDSSCFHLLIINYILNNTFKFPAALFTPGALKNNYDIHKSHNC